MAGRLAGIRVVDLSQIVSEPMAAAMLGDQSPHIIKVESPGPKPVPALRPRKDDREASPAGPGCAETVAVNAGCSGTYGSKRQYGADQARGSRKLARPQQ